MVLFLLFMKNTYHTTTKIPNRRYTFVSEGRRGHYTKIVEFLPLDEDSIIYNLALADLILDDTHHIVVDDLSLSGNNDSLRIFNTVALIAYEFLIENKSAILFVVGSDMKRTKLYRKLLIRYKSQIDENRILIFNIHFDLVTKFEDDSLEDGFYVTLIHDV